MNIILKHGLSLLKFTAITPSNFGTQWAQTALDSPTQIDSQWGLPFIPDSAIKGVLKAGFEPIGAGGFESVFGMPDGMAIDNTIHRFGIPGSLIFGNAHLFSFPFRFRNGKTAHIIPSFTLFYLERFVPGVLEDERVINILIEILADDRKGILRVLALRPDFYAVCSLPLIPALQSVHSRAHEGLHSMLSLFFEDYDLQNNDFLFVGPNTAFRLWRLADDQRSQIRLGQTGTTEMGSLRRIQLIPSESVFVSIVLNESKESISLLEDRAALGAWEKSGFGWFRLGKLSLDAKKKGSLRNSFSNNTKCDFINEEEAIAKAYQAVSEFQENSRIAEKIQTISNDFGLVLKKSGLDSALAFGLAKAKPWSLKVSDEVFAYRWFLAHILDIPKCQKKQDASFPALGELVVDLLINPPLPVGRQQEITAAWSWLKRYTEIGFVL